MGSTSCCSNSSLPATEIHFSIRLVATLSTAFESTENSTFDTVKPFYFEAGLPAEVTAQDRIEIPVAFFARQTGSDKASVSFSVSGPAKVVGPQRLEADLVKGRGRARG